MNCHEPCLSLKSLFKYRAMFLSDAHTAYRLLLNLLNILLKPFELAKLQSHEAHDMRLCLCPVHHLEAQGAYHDPNIAHIDLKNV